MASGKLDPVFLWPGRAPGAKGDTLEDRPRLTPYLPEGGGPRGCVIVCPGGGYTGRAPHEAEPVALWLAGLGLAAAVLDYRVAPYRHPMPLLDARRAIRTVRHRAGEWGIDPGRVGILGFSAGGHLAASAATLFDEGNSTAADPVDRLSSRPDALILGYPVITFGPHGHVGSMEALLGRNPPEDLREGLSLETSVTAATPPTFLWHTADDAGVPVEHSLLMAEALRRHGVPLALHVFPRGVHGLGLAPEDPTVRQWTLLAARWLRDIGFATA